MNEIEYINHRLMINEHRRKKIEQARKIWNDDCNYSHKEFDEVMHSKSLTENPYHNAYHTACMIVNAAEAFNWYWNRQGEKLTNPNALIRACLYHDVGHTAGKHPDSINIVIATTTFLNSRPNDFETVKIIQVTEFPFIREPVSLEEKIIRDCDLMQMLEPDWLEQIFVGLYTELLNHPKFTDLTPEKFIQMQITFLESALFYTEWFEKTRREKWNAAIKLAKGVKV